MRRAAWWVLSLAVLGTAACGMRKTTISPADDTPQDQWSRGVWLYGQQCAGCHGDDGAGDEDSPALVGKGALRHRPAGANDEPEGVNETAADLHAYLRRDKPPLEPGSLSDEDAWVLVVYLLKQAGIQGPAGDLGPGNAASVEIPAGD